MLSSKYCDSQYFGVPRLLKLSAVKHKRHRVTQDANEVAEKGHPT